MRKEILAALGTAVLTAILAIPAIAANQKPVTENQKATASITKAVPGAWPAESLAGTITGVDANKRIVIIKDSNGVPFDMVVNRSTRIKSGSSDLSLRDLASDVNKRASIRFVPERSGDMARSIQIG